VPSILLVSAVLVCGGVLALAYRGEQAHARYSQLQQEKAVLRSRSGVDSAADEAQQQQQHKPRRQQRQPWQQQQEQQPELELLRGSSGDSQYSSQYSSYRPSAEG
jgi:Mg-chelatase subunit ChlI